MANIQERTDSKGKKSFTAVIRLKGHPTVTATFERKTDANIWVQKTETEIRENRYFKTAEAKKHTLSQLIARFKADVIPKRKDGAKVSTHLQWWDDQLGPYLLSDITPVKISEYRDRLAKEPVSKGKQQTIKTPATVNRYLASLSILFTRAIEWGWVQDNPMSRVRKLTEPRGRVRFLEEDEREALLRECQKSASPHLYPIVVLALSTGARFSEIVNLSWKEVDLKKKHLRLEVTKNGDPRSIPIPGFAYDLLLTLHQQRKLNIKYVFPSKDGKKPTDIRDAWELALARANIKDFRFHDLRHTAASYLTMNGANHIEVAAILGHKTLAMVKRYSHLAEQHTVNVLERMNAKQFEKHLKDVH